MRAELEALIEFRSFHFLFRLGCLAISANPALWALDRIGAAPAIAFLFAATPCNLPVELPRRDAEISGATGSRYAVGGQIATSEIAVSSSVIGARRGER
jgi:hypothetical protein